MYEDIKPLKNKIKERKEYMWFFVKCKEKVRVWLSEWLRVIHSGKIPTGSGSWKSSPGCDKEVEPSWKIHWRNFSDVSSLSATINYLHKKKRLKLEKDDIQIRHKIKHKISHTLKGIIKVKERNQLEIEVKNLHCCHWNIKDTRYYILKLDTVINYINTR